MFEGASAFLEIEQQRIQRHQRHLDLVVVASHDVDLPPLPRFADQIGQVGMLFDDGCGIGGSEQQVDRWIGRQQAFEVVVDDFGDDEAEVHEVALDRVEPFASLVQRFETDRQVGPGRLAVSGHNRFGSHHRFALQEDFVEVVEVMHVPGQQFHLQVAAAQGEKIGDEVGVECDVRIRIVAGQVRIRCVAG